MASISISCPFSSSSSIAHNAASLTKFAKSAPVNFSVMSPMRSRSTSGANGVLRKAHTRISTRSLLVSGALTNKSRSKRPGRSKASSIKSGRFVAAMTAIFSCFIEEFNPSISCNNCVTTRSYTELPSDFVSPPREEAKPSISSMKIIDGATLRARLKSVLTAFSDSPTYFENNSGPFTAKKFRFDCEATARAKVVFEHPGGPYNKIPFGGFAPIFCITSGCVSAHSTSSSNDLFVSSWPPTSSQLTFGISTLMSRIAEGRARFFATIKSSTVTLFVDTDDLIASSVSPSCKADIVPEISLSLFCCLTIILRMAFEAASRTSCAISAPTNPCIVHTVSRIISSVKSCRIVPKCDFKISNLC
mmetsp:Transcript_10190/g.29290  ORF Transcript_10190/g.29290 Transcript_10190/m.29290 type:complete len:361 (+) Transcript_10190:181-1263(+)